MGTALKSKLDEMKEAGITELSKGLSMVELVLYKGAKYTLPETRFDEDGWGTRPLNIPGFLPTSEMTDNPGDRVIGYVAQYKGNRIFLTNWINGGMPVKDRALYFHQDTIYSFQEISLP